MVIMLGGLVVLFLGLFIGGVIAVCVMYCTKKKKKQELSNQLLSSLGIPNWYFIPKYDDYVTVKSRQALTNYSDITYYKEKNIDNVIAIFNNKSFNVPRFQNFLSYNEYRENKYYKDFVPLINNLIFNASCYRVHIRYVTPSGKVGGESELSISRERLDYVRSNPALLMTKGEYSKYIKEQEKQALDRKQHLFFDKVNGIIDAANANKDKLVIKKNKEILDNLISRLFDKQILNVAKIKKIDSEEWGLADKYVQDIEIQVDSILKENQKIQDYYSSADFAKIKETCNNLTTSQREFNEYIEEKAQSISKLFGTRVVRNETENNDEYNYIRPYKKTITPFTAEVSATVFASAENNPLDYVVKYFYPNKDIYPEQIQKLKVLVEELETLKDAKQIIENYKLEYKQYIEGVPAYILEKDESGFYSRLGFANIDEDVLTIEYKFSYTSDGGMAQRTFTVPMDEDTIVELVGKLSSKLTAAAFAKEQRTLMTKKLRQHIKERDNFTCCTCGNSTNVEPNLLLEIDHIIPVAKGGITEEGNLQTLCWKCNRSKGSKLLA